MPLFGNKFKAEPPKVRIEKVVVERKTKPPRLSVTASPSSSRCPSRPTTPARLVKPERKKRKAAGHDLATPTTATTTTTTTTTTVAFDKDSDNDDDGWMRLDSRKRQRKRSADDDDAGRLLDSRRQIRCAAAYQGRIPGLKLIHAVEVASLDAGCVPVMGAQKEDVDIELQYPSLQPREKFQLVWGKGKMDAVEASIRIVRHVAETYLPEDEAEPLTNHHNGLIRRLEKASNRNIQDLAGFKAALHEYNETLLGLVEDGVVDKRLEAVGELPRTLVAFVLDQVYDRTVAPKIELLSKYENGSDHVYGELLHPFVSKILVDQARMTSDQLFVDLGSGVGNVCLQAALEIGCDSWGCEVQENACNLAEAQKDEFAARCMLWGLEPGRVHLERGDFRKNSAIHKALKRADVVLVNNKAFTAQLNDDLVRMFLDLKTGCKVVSLRSFVGDCKGGHNINDVGSTILHVEECTYPEGYVSWTNAGGSYYISTRK
ncbi:hypothetical protein CDD80_132 [Ophiocordyceps camponoti-rufipedis]|uniref:Histone-lysine N-methyltransferase, H3 lysine-79 specific n=1 Tax=Ophiocordyceps camponoti-rufipedis TaxID=2004952 RepID=A0A2C5ZDS4_9HYPO|nr:hypothetical protein CDD80_132 [Ophiocordyceps camponoti-rufipedis]